MVHVACHSNSTGSISASVSGGVGNYTFLWSTGATTDSVSHLPAGDYSVTVTDANGVTNTSSVTIRQPGIYLFLAICYTIVILFVQMRN